MLSSLLAKISLRFPWIATPFLLLCGGCNLFAETENPMPMQIFGNPQTAEHVVVLLPGIRDRAADFVNKGFVDDAQVLIGSGKLSLILTDAHVGYYRERLVAERLQVDLLDRWPRRKFILAGVSLGGFGALTLARRHPARIESLLLLAPFLGEKHFLKRIEKSRPQALSGDGMLEQELVPVWQFLLSKDKPFTALAYGRSDSFAGHYSTLQQLGADIPSVIIDGGHDWNVWRQLWQRWLGTLDNPSGRFEQF